MLQKLSFDINGYHVHGCQTVIGLGFLGITLLSGLKKFFAGGRCFIEKDLSGYTAVVTGGNTGIGKETCRKLGDLGCLVIFGARDTDKNNETVAELSKTAKGKVIGLRLDLSDKNSILEFSKEVKIRLEGRGLNFLVNNAGIMAIPERKLTRDGVEMQIGVNHFGHFYLTSLLWEKLKVTANPRIINVSSIAHE